MSITVTLNISEPSPPVFGYILKQKINEVEQEINFTFSKQKKYIYLADLLIGIWDPKCHQDSNNLHSLNFGILTGSLLEKISNLKKRRSLPSCFYKTILHLRKPKNIVISRSDKCNQIVLMNIEDYKQRSYDINNTDVYIKLKSN